MNFGIFKTQMSRPAKIRYAQEAIRQASAKSLLRLPMHDKASALDFARTVMQEDVEHLLCQIAIFMNFVELTGNQTSALSFDCQIIDCTPIM